jgi:AraC family transcriptional regulator
VTRIPEIQNQSEPRVSYGVMWHQQDSDVLHYMAGVSVTAVGRIPQGMDIVTLPAGTYAAFKYPFSGLTKGFGEIFNRLLPSSEFVLVAGPSFERYDESFDPNDASSMVEICLPVQRRRAVVNS